MNNDILIRIIGVAALLLLILSLIIASPSNSNHTAAYRCRSCGANSNNGQQHPPQTAEIKSLEGQEKEEAVEKALSTKEFRLVASILSKIGYQPSLDDSTAMRAKKVVNYKPTEYMVVGIRFVGDPKSRLVFAVVFVKPYQEATVYRADEGYRILEVLVRAEKGRVTGGKLVPTIQANQVINPIDHAFLTGVPPPPCSPPCGTCQFCFQECLAYDIPQVILCCAYCTSFIQVPVAMMMCLVLLCPACFSLNCISWSSYCQDCTPDTSYLPECMDCP